MKNYKNQIGRDKKMIYDTKESEDLIVAVSQYKTVNYTWEFFRILDLDNTPAFTKLILFDGTHVADRSHLNGVADIEIVLKGRINSLPSIWNMLFGMAKLTRAKYLLWAGSDMKFRKDSVNSMLQLMISDPEIDIVSPIKIDNDMDKFDNYAPVFTDTKEIIGFNDSAALFRLDKMPFFPFEYEYAPYQFESTALAYRLWKSDCKSVLDRNAVIFHYCSKDIEHSPDERKIGSETWDEKLEIFKDKNIEDEHMQWFVDNVILNSNNANKFGFPCWVQGLKFQ